MTLNIAVAGEHSIFQSSDFCFAEWDASSRSWVPVREFGFKQEVFAGPGWTAIVGFCGVATTSDGRIETGRWLVEQREAFAYETATYQDFIRVLLSAHSWWGRLGAPRSELTFVVTALVDGHPTVSMVSNVARVDGPDLPARGPILVASTTRLSQTRVFVRGIGAHLVRRNDRRALARLADRSNDPEVVRKRLAAINGRVARSNECRGAVTEACMVAHVPASGSATFVPYGTANSEGDFIPTDAQAVLDLALASGEISRQFDASGKPMPLRVVQSSRVVSPGPTGSLSITFPRDVGGTSDPVPTEGP